MARTSSPVLTSQGRMRQLTASFHVLRSRRPSSSSVYRALSGFLCSPLSPPLQNSGKRRRSGGKKIANPSVRTHVWRPTQPLTELRLRSALLSATVHFSRVRTAIVSSLSFFPRRASKRASERERERERESFSTSGDEKERRRKRRWREREKSRDIICCS